jgi:hypothetical protein
MTMPNERTRALVAAAAFLERLRFAEETTEKIRAEACHILRHFPDEDTINEMARIATSEKPGKIARFLARDERK